MPLTQEEQTELALRVPEIMAALCDLITLLLEDAADSTIATKAAAAHALSENLLTDLVAELQD
jgi:hypothetical protein